MSDLSDRFTQFLSDYDEATDTSGLNLYEDLPELYEAFYANHYDYGGLADFVEEYTELSDDSVIVEGACGTGHLLEQFDDTEYETFGFDISPEMLAIADKNTDATLFRSDLVDFYIPNNVDCLLVLGNSLFHLDAEQRHEFFKQAYENMSNRSTIIFSYMDANEIIDGHSDAAMYTVGPWEIRRNSILVDEGDEELNVGFSYRVSDDSDTVKLQAGIAMDGHAHSPKEIESELNNVGFSNITIAKPDGHHHTITIARKVS